MTRGDARAAAFAEAAASLRLAWPLIVAQLATIALNTTDVVMMGWLGPEQLAGGALATSLAFPLFICGAGVVTATAPLVAQALGARKPRQLRRSVRQGLWIALMMSALMAPILLAAEPILLAAGQSPVTAGHAADYLRWAWMMLPFGLMMAPLRALVSAHGRTGLVLAVSLTGVAVNILADWVLIFGKLGAPALGMAGAGIATSLTHAAMTGLIALIAARRRPFRRYAVFARFWRPDWPLFRQMLVLGAPIGLIMAAESGLFSAAAVMMGWIGADALAGHSVALQLAATAFMVPLGLSHATTIRVGLAVGRGDRVGAAQAGWVSLALALMFMSCTATLFIAAPEALIGLFLDPAEPRNAAPFTLAVGYLAIAALFQLFDGAQAAAAAALRGLSDTAWPAAIALGGYWAVGLPVGWIAAFPLGLEGRGLWFGLAAGLAVAAVVLSARFWKLTRASEFTN